MKTSIIFPYFFILTAFIVVTNNTYGQGFGYDFTYTTTSVFTPLPDDANRISIDEIETDDALSNQIDIPFGLEYFGTSGIDHIKVSSNGWLTFDMSETSSRHINNANLGRMMIAPLWDDLSGQGGQASYSITGGTGNRIVTFEWLNWRWQYTANPASLSFQVKLYENGNRIEMCYRSESGVITNPSAAVGIAGFGAFYWLSDVVTPTFEPNGYDDVGTMPAENTVFAFAPSTNTVSPPTIQASNIIASGIGLDQFTLTWTNGNGAYRTVFVQEEVPTSPALALSDGIFYESSSVYGASPPVGAWACVYNGTGNTVTVTGLQGGVTYNVQVVEYNGLGGTQRYLTTATPGNPVTASTIVTAPTGPESTITGIWLNENSIQAWLIPGDGQHRVVFIKEGTVGPPLALTDDNTYTPSSVFGAGTQAGASGWYCVWASNNFAAVTITGLMPNTDYQMQIINFNGSPGSEKYQNITTTFNLLQFKTFQSPSTSGYFFSPEVGTFMPIAGGTDVDIIETDEAMSGPIPIGFTFNFAGTEFTEVKASSNGFLSFNPFATAFGDLYAVNGLTDGLARPMIAPLYDDMDSWTNGQASYITEGTAPNRVFTFEWLNWHWDYTAISPVISFQAKLYENGRIEFVYKREDGNLSSPSASIGLAFTDAGSPNFLSLSDSGPAPTVSSTSEMSIIAAKPASGQIYVFDPNSQSQTITFSAPDPKTFGDATFALTAIASSGLSVSYQSSDPGVATISGNIVTIIGAGTCEITASQPGNTTYRPADDVTQTLTVNKADQTITFAELMPRGIDDLPFDLTAASSSGLPVTFTSSDPAVASVSGNTVTIEGLGSAFIIASQAGNSNYNVAADVPRQLTVKQNQVINFTQPAAKTFSDAPFQLDGIATSGLTVSYTSSNPQVATVAGSTVTITGSGTTELTASQAGDASYNAAPTRSHTLTVNKADQSITFSQLPEKLISDGPFLLDATATSGLVLTYASSNTTVATVSGNTVTMLAVGTTEITASQSGDANYNPAPDVVRTLTINKVGQSITFAELPAKTIGEAPFVLAATASSGLPVSYTSVSNKISIAGNVVTLLHPGSVTVIAEQPGNNNYAYTSAERSFCINPAKPVIAIIEGSEPEAVVLRSNYDTGNQWYKDGALLPGDTESYLTVTVPGSYSVMSTVDNCSSVMSDAQSIIITGLEETNGGVTVYPNPAAREVIIDLTSFRSRVPVHLAIYDVMGREVHYSTGGRKVSVCVEDFSPGLYFVRIQGSESIVTRQLIKK